MQSYNVTTQVNILQQLNSNSSLPATTYASANPVVAENCGDNLQEILNNIANRPTNLGYGCGVALRKKMEDIKQQCNAMKKSAEEFKKQCQIFKDRLLPSPGTFGWFDSWFNFHNSNNKLASAAHDLGESLLDRQKVADCFKKAEELEQQANRCPSL